MAVTFRNSCFSLFRIKNLKKSYFFKAGTYLHSTNFFRKATFWKKIIFQKSNIPHNLLFLEGFFLERLLFQKTVPSIAALLSEELLLHNILFQKRYYFTAKPLFHSCTSQLFASNLLNLLIYFLYIYYCSKLHHRWVKKLSWSKKVLWNCQFMMKLLFDWIIFSEPLLFKDPCLF